MSKQYNSYTEEFKKIIVALYESRKKVAELVSEYDLEKKLIYNWIKKYGKIKTEAGFITNNDELLKLKKEDGEIRTDWGGIVPMVKENREFGRVYFEKVE